MQRDALALEEKSMRDEYAANEDREAAEAILVSKINEQDTKINELTAMLAKRNLEFDSLAFVLTFTIRKTQGVIF